MVMRSGRVAVVSSFRVSVFVVRDPGRDRQRGVPGTVLLIVDAVLVVGSIVAAHYWARFDEQRRS